MSEKIQGKEPLDIPLIEKDQFGLDILTDEGKKRIAEYVSDVEGDVYALQNMSEEMAATAMARLSRSSEGVRVILAREFIDNEDKVDVVANRIVNEFGDDSVKQLGGGIKIVVENASNLLTKYVEWGRLAGYIEQSTRYIFFDRRGADGRYRYHTPESLSPEARQGFETYADYIFDSYSEIVRGTTEYIRSTKDKPEDLKEVAWKSVTRAQACDAARLLLPVATTATVGITASAHSYENLAINLLSSDNAESRKAGENILREARKLAPILLAKTDEPSRGGAVAAYKAETRRNIRELAPSVELEPQNLESGAQLLEYSPKHELELLPHLLYKYSNMSIKELEAEVGNWNDNELLKAFTAYMGERTNRRQRPDRALEVGQYVWDIVCDYGIFRDLQRHRIVDALEWQELHPYFGYEVPQLLKDSGYEDKVHEVFKASLKHYESMKDQDYPEESQYATLLGHKMRWKWAFNAREAFHLLELRTQPSGHPGYIKLCQEMYDLVSRVHPRLAEAMVFINTKGENEELTRLGEARANQRRRELLGAAAIEYDSSDI